MRTVLRTLLIVATLSVPVTAQAMMIAPSPLPQRVATADLVVLGKVVSIEPKTVKARRFPHDKDKGEYQIAVVKINETLYGGKGLTHVRVGFIPPVPQPPVVPVNPGGGVGPVAVIRTGGNSPVVVLKKDQEVCLFLKNHFDAEFMTAPMYFDAINKTSPNFEKELAEVRRCGKLLADPLAGLKSEKAQDRFTTAAMLIVQYRSARPYMVTKKTEPIDAAESKLILKALADADWAQQPGRLDQMAPQTIFSWLGLTPKEGWQQPKDYRQIAEAAKNWLAKNKDTYRIQKLVLEKAPR